MITRTNVTYLMRSRQIKPASTSKTWFRETRERANKSIMCNCGCDPAYHS